MVLIPSIEITVLTQKVVSIDSIIRALSEIRNPKERNFRKT